MNFDQYIDRNEYLTMKWSESFLSEHFGNIAAIPMSVADMDLLAPPVVIEQLQKRVAHGIYGYESKPDNYSSVLEAWYQTRHGWQINSEHIEQCPSILNAVSILINQHSAEKNGVILQSPVFFEFRMVVKSNRRRIIKNALKLVDGQYKFDFVDLEKKAANPNNKILILCNPHNPIGRVWTKAELTQVADICHRHGIFVISDEIHGDFAFPPYSYTPYLTVSESAAQNAAACISPAKTFNIPGIVDALTIIPNQAHREQFHDFAHRYQINKNNVFSMAATEAAYRDGAAWLDGLLVYLQGNIDLIDTFLQENKLGVSLVPVEGTFLAWVDFRELKMDAKVLEKFLAQDAGLALSPGYWFGREGAGFARMTIACPRTTVQRALDQLAKAINALEK